MSDLVCFIEYSAVLPIGYVLSMVLMLWLIYKYFKSMKSEQNKPLKYLGFVLFTAQTTYCMIHGLSYIIFAFSLNCVEGSDFMRGVGVATAILFLTQYAVLMVLLFYRSKLVFEGTAFELSQFTVWTFYIMYISAIILGIFVSFSNDLSGETGLSSLQTILTLLCGLIGISIVSFLTVLFVKKLVDVNKYNDDNNLLSTITKQTILSLISIASMLVLFAIIAADTATGLLSSSNHGAFIWNLFTLSDVWTNFLCIWLAYGAFGDYYDKICGCCDAKCKQFCSKLSKPKTNGKKAIDDVESMSGDGMQSVTV